MIINSTLILFYSNVLLGVALSLSSNNWVMIWLGLELSLLSIIPMMNDYISISSECTMKYFIVQSMSSSIFILGIILMLLNYNFNFKIIIVLSMMLKMGVAPFHTWIVSIIDGLNYMVMFNLLTVMKIVPMMIIINMNLNLNLIIIFTLIVGSISGLNQNSMRKILTYSSIFNMGFMIYCSSNLSLWILYFVLYSINLLMLSIILMLNNVNYLNQFLINKINLKTKVTIWILMLSSGGMPPMMGFMSKLIVIELSINFNDWMVTLMMILTSLLTMFYYNRLCFIVMLTSSLITKWSINSLSWMNINILIMNLMTFPLIILFKYLN
uniref:NADH-ubiquinone oxidoreductase chain 2 n=1 Tax=Idioscopus sp. 'myrica' TaxID=2419687 RepID=A0A386PYY3_9HEMI|nr:NADH dehydrogenase subunit 2 [Idioscopus sp. 'myrica']WEP24784.1 NADH dehydrogenase subunit 2 [Idioscopus sp. 'myrica']